MEVTSRPSVLLSKKAPNFASHLRFILAKKQKLKRTVSLTQTVRFEPVLLVD